MPNTERELIAPLIATRGASFSYEGTPGAVMSQVELALPAGELVVLLGPNGGGKTTLFRALLGEVSVTDGSVDVNAPVAYLPQHDASRLDFPVTAFDVTMMGTLRERRPWQRAGRADRERAEVALERVGLAGQRKRPYGELSGGQRRRVLLARTVVQQAPILLLDEPMAGVDPASGEIIRKTLAALRDDGRLVIVASHDVGHAQEADRVLCVNRRLVADGPPAAVLVEKTLRETYGAELTVVGGDDGSSPSFAAVEHHHH
ncbi:MAG TPA: metal ABC transporter ATP-binding protein [Solirubrobacterales bacterium]|jgi:manganese/iron transport system ATP-binding protein/manganese/zinc/iron transport system ATP- binding protein|nr:metal ABC transporter ATP-binding protein [Solirubrobacterales bacterium]